MITSRVTVAIWCLGIAGCGGGCGGNGGPLVDDDPPVDEHAGGETRPPPSDTSPDVVDPGPAPILRVVGVPDSHTRVVAVRIENRGDETVQLASTFELQHRRGDAWTVADSVHLELRYSCEDEAAECVTLAPGAIYLPPGWLGTIGDAQCECARCGAAEAGTYRFVVGSCNGAHSVEGEPFELH